MTVVEAIIAGLEFSPQCQKRLIFGIHNPGHPPLRPLVHRWAVSDTDAAQRQEVLAAANAAFVAKPRTCRCVADRAGRGQEQFVARSANADRQRRMNKWLQSRALKRTPIDLRTSWGSLPSICGASFHANSSRPCSSGRSLLGHQTERDESLREQLAQFLHDHHERTAGR